MDRLLPKVINVLMKIAINTEYSYLKLQLGV